MEPEITLSPCPISTTITTGSLDFIFGTLGLEVLFHTLYDQILIFQPERRDISCRRQGGIILAKMASELLCISRQFPSRNRVIDGQQLIFFFVMFIGSTGWVKHSHRSYIYHPISLIFTKNAKIRRSWQV